MLIERLVTDKETFLGIARVLWNRCLPLVFKIENTVQTSENEFKGWLPKAYFCPTRVLQKILQFGGLGKEINRQLRMKVRSYVNCRMVTDKILEFGGLRKECEIGILIQSFVIDKGNFLRVSRVL